MIPFLKKTTLVLCAAAVALSLSGCGKQETSQTLSPDSTEIITLPTAPVIQETTAPTDPREQVEELSVVMVAGELYTLDYYPNLKSVDLSGSTCYDAILDYIDKHPNVAVTYSVSLGSLSVSSQAQEVSLASGEFDYDTLLENLQFLPNLTTIALPGVNLTPAEIDTLLAAYPNITLDYTVELFGNTYGLDTTQLDLGSLSSSGVDEAIRKLGLLTNLTDVNLPSSLSLDDVARLQDAAPHTTFHYSFYLFGKTLSTTDETVEYKNLNIGNDGEAQIRQALAVLDNCSRFVLDNCQLDNEVLAGIREDFRDGPKVVWRVYFGKDNRYTTLTDDDTIRAVYNVTDATCGPMKYLEDVKYMDIGHNEYLSDLSFVSYMPQLEVLIASESAVKELTGFDNCKNLTWLELAYCYKLENIDALAGCAGLKYLNISYSKVKSFEPLDGLPLERFVYLSPKASTAEQNTFTAIHPKGQCITVFYGYSMPYSYGWRYDDNGKTMFWYYKDVIRKVFNYDQADAILKAQENAK